MTGRTPAPGGGSFVGGVVNGSAWLGRIVPVRTSLDPSSTEALAVDGSEALWIAGYVP